jgi:hypothetical protein
LGSKPSYHGFLVILQSGGLYSFSTPPVFLKPTPLPPPRVNEQGLGRGWFLDQSRGRPMLSIGKPTLVSLACHLPSQTLFQQKPLHFATKVGPTPVSRGVRPRDVSECWLCPPTACPRCMLNVVLPAGKPASHDSSRMFTALASATWRICDVYS